MKKIFTLLFAAALATPMISAEDVTVSLYVCSGVGENITPGKFLGSMKNAVTYDEAAGTYDVTNFLGYENGNINFSLMNDEKFPSGSGEQRIPLGFNIPKGSIVYAKNGNIKTQWGFHLTDEDLDETDLAEIDILDSGVFMGNDDTDYEALKLVDVTMYGVCDDSGQAAFENTKKRSFAIAIDGGYKLFVSLCPIAYRVSMGGEYSYTTPEDDLAWDLELPEYCLAVFNTPGASSGVSDITVDNEAAVEYFNLQGVRVNNPTNGLYIMRQGAKTQKVSIR